jgi:DNA-binding transcriptional LysR family regulator
VVFSVGFVSGVTPDRWSRAWRTRETEELNLAPVNPSDQEKVLLSGQYDACFVRLPVDRDHVHCITLYSEVPVVVVPKDHVVTAYEEIALTDLADEQLVLGDVPDWAQVSTTPQLAFPKMSVKEAVDVVASGTGIVIVPMSVARMHHRKDVEHRRVLGVPQTEIGLAWRTDNDDPRIQTFIGIVRGRTENSSRSRETGTRPEKKRSASQKAADKQARQQARGQTRGQGTVRPGKWS